MVGFRQLASAYFRGCRTCVRPCPHGATRAIHTFPCHVMIAWPHAAMEAHANRSCAMWRRAHVRPCTPETRTGPCASDGPLGGPMCPHATRDSMGPGGHRVRMGLNALNVTCPCRHGLACTQAGWVDRDVVPGSSHFKQAIGWLAMLLCAQKIQINADSKYPPHCGMYWGMKHCKVQAACRTALATISIAHVVLFKTKRLGSIASWRGMSTGTSPFL